MRVTCPTCSRVYEIPEEMLGRSRQLQCSNCQTSWSWHAQAPFGQSPEDGQVPEEAAHSAPDEDHRVTSESEFDETTGDHVDDEKQPGRDDFGQDGSEVASSARARLVVNTQVRHAAPILTWEAADRKPWLVGWAVTILVVAAVSGSVWHWRSDVVHAFPATKKLVALFA